MFKLSFSLLHGLSHRKADPDSVLWATGHRQQRQQSSLPCSHIFCPQMERIFVVGVRTSTSGMFPNIIPAIIAGCYHAIGFLSDLCFLGLHDLTSSAGSSYPEFSDVSNAVPSTTGLV